MATFYAGQTDYIDALNTLATTAELAGVAGAVSSVTFYAGQTDYIDALNTLATTAELAGVAGAVSSVTAFASAAAGSATTATTKAGESATSATNAATSAATATTKAAEASTSAATATTQASSATTSSASASAARDLAIAAWAASTAPAETLAAISQSLHVGAIVKSIIYDTSKDSDSGAWRKRCTDKSWFTEALGGNRWVGQRASVGAAWTAAGSATGAVYQSSADGKYYTPLSSTTQTEVFRGIAREFPEQVAVVAESGRVVLYDLTVPGAPMWMVFVRANQYFIRWNDSVISSVAATQGSLFFGVNSGAAPGIAAVSFVADSFVFNRGPIGVEVLVSGGVSLRNNSQSYSYGLPAKYPAIVNAAVNDIAVTVLEGAPVDPATGLPVPTVFVGTNGGVSRIAHDGTVSNCAVYSRFTSVTCDSRWLYISDNVTTWKTSVNLALSNSTTSGFADSYKSLSFTPSTSLSVPLGFLASNAKAVMGTSQIAAASASGVAKIQDGRTFPGHINGMTAAITNAYNSGWQVGDSRFAGLADTTPETITAPELVTNGTFDTDVSGWTGVLQATISNVGQKLRVTAVGGTQPYARQIVTVVPGKTYQITCDASISPTANTSWKLYVGSTSNTYSVEYANVSLVSAAKVFVTATNTTLNISINGVIVTIGDYADFDNISVKQIDPDRSVKNNGLIVNGTLTKTAVASGANLVAYSGFSAANYLEQPYSANLDFGTGDFCVMGWLFCPTNFAGDTWEYLFDRKRVSDGADRWYFTKESASAKMVFSGVASTLLLTQGWNLVAAYRRFGVLYFSINGVEQMHASVGSNYSPTAATTAPVLLVGSSSNAGYSKTLLRISATAPSADQIAQIYRDELALFQPGAQCTIAGTSTAVTALAYDESTDLLHVGTSWGRTGFKGLLRVDSEATTTGSITSLSAVQGSVLTGGTSAKFYQPALQLRDELARNEEARRALGKVPVFIDFTATASQTAFVLAVGYTIKALYRNGVLMRETTTGVFWTRSNDGYRETATLSVGATVGDWISLMCIRSN